MNPFDLPLFLPAMLAIAIGAIAGADRLARATGASRTLGALVIVSFGVVVAATLTPQAGAFRGELGSGTCDLTRLRPADLREYLRVGEALGNILLVLPLGVTLALLPPSRTRSGLIALAISLPFVVEGFQLVLPALDRACQGADLVDNLLGLGLGLLLGALLGRWARWVRPAGHRNRRSVDSPGNDPRSPS